MPLPERMRPAKVSSKKISELAKMAAEILSRIDNGVEKNDAELKTMITDWNSQVSCPYAFSDFRDASSHTSAREFTRIALNFAKFYEDFTWSELVQAINCILEENASESEQHHALSLLEKNFNGNPSDLIFWPDVWFQEAGMLEVELTTEEIAAYLMARSGRALSDAPVIKLRYPIPNG